MDSVKGGDGIVESDDQGIETTTVAHAGARNRQSGGCNAENAVRAIDAVAEHAEGPVAHERINN